MEVRLELWHCLLDGALKTRADGIKKVLFRDGFGEVVICTEVHSSANVWLFTFCRKEDEQDGDNLYGSAEGSDHAIAVQFRDHHFAKNEIGFSFFANSTPTRPFSAVSARNCSSRRTVVRLRRISGSSSIIVVHEAKGSVARSFRDDWD